MESNLIADILTERLTTSAGITGGWDGNFLDMNIINVNDFTELVTRFLLNTGLVLVIVHFMYARHSRRKDFYFSYLAISAVVFMLCFLLNNVKLELGFALGLFAIFGIIRYRTSTIPIKEMTYLFIIIGISVINALTNKQISYAELVFTNVIIVMGLWLLELVLSLKQEESVCIVYEKIENINILSEKNMLKDLKERTGIDVKRYKIEKIDFLKDVADIIIYYEINGKAGEADDNK
jgi:hypothetical protein